MRDRGAFFFFNDTATTEIYTLSLHDALPISAGTRCASSTRPGTSRRDSRWTSPSASDARSRRIDLCAARAYVCPRTDRKSTRLNSSHANISYAVFCLKKKIKQQAVQLLSSVE